MENPGRNANAERAVAQFEAAAERAKAAIRQAQEACRQAIEALQAGHLDEGMRSSCDVCGATDRPIATVIVYGTESNVCDKCRGDA